MRIGDLAGKNICILGFGKEGQSVLAALEKYAPGCEVTIADQNEQVVVPDKHWKQLGTGWLHNLEKFDVIIKSPGIPPSPELNAQSAKLTTATNIFFDSIEDSGATVIGVTGSKGKSTTASLIYECLKRAEKDAHLVGNIGKPVLDHLEYAKEGTIFVMEMSSYQLMDCTKSPHIAVLTSFFPEHLDFHGSLDAYFEAKAHIVKFQTSEDFVFYPEDSAEMRRMAKMSAGKKISFVPDDCPLAITETKLIGDHNRSNCAAAFKVALHLGIDRTACREAFRMFEPLPHRLQSLGVHHNIEWMDDAISTTPDSTIAALRALGERVRTIILGGTDRGLNFQTLAEELVPHSNVTTVILFPGSGPKIRTAIEAQMSTKVDRKITLMEANSMEEAVKIAKEKTPQSSIVLLSTASPSYNMFKNFEEKGDRFRQCIESL